MKKDPRIRKNAKMIDIKEVECTFCGSKHKTWTYNDERLRSRVTGKLVRFSDHKCPELEEIGKEFDKVKRSIGLR